MHRRKFSNINSEGKYAIDSAAHVCKALTLEMTTCRDVDNLQQSSCACCQLGILANTSHSPLNLESRCSPSAKRRWNKTASDSWQLKITRHAWRTTDMRCRHWLNHRCWLNTGG